MLLCPQTHERLESLSVNRSLHIPGRDQAMAAKLGSSEEASPDTPTAQLAAAASFASVQRRAAHHGLMSALAGSAPAFPAAARMAQRWLGAQMLSNQIFLEAGELLVAAAFSPERGLSVPGKHSQAFGSTLPFSVQ